MCTDSGELFEALHHLAPLYKLARTVMTAPAYPYTLPTPSHIANNF